MHSSCQLVSLFKNVQYCLDEMQRIFRFLCLVKNLLAMNLFDISKVCLVNNLKPFYGIRVVQQKLILFSPDTYLPFYQIWTALRGSSMHIETPWTVVPLLLLSLNPVHTNTSVFEKLLQFVCTVENNTLQFVSKCRKQQKGKLDFTVPLQFKKPHLLTNTLGQI